MKGRTGLFHCPHLSTGMFCFDFFFSNKQRVFSELPAPSQLLCPLSHSSPPLAALRLLRELSLPLHFSAFGPLNIASEEMHLCVSSGSRLVGGLDHSRLSLGLSGFRVMYKNGVDLYAENQLQLYS